MADQVFNCGKRYILENGLGGGKDLRAALVMTNTTVDTENDGISVVSDFTTLDEMDGANYVRKELTEAFSTDDANDRAEFDANDIAWTSLGNGTRQIQGWLLFVHITDDDSSVPIAYYDLSGLTNPGGANFAFSFNAEGLLQQT